MKNTTYKQYIAWGITVFTVIALSILLFFLLYRAKGLGDALHSLINILKPIIYGVALAYVLNPIYRRCENLLAPMLARRSKKPGRARYWSHFISTVITLALTFIIILGLLNLVIPQLAITLAGLVEKMPGYLPALRLWLGQILEDNPYVGQLVITAYQALADYVEQWLRTEMLPMLGGWAAHAYSGLLNAVKELFNFFIGVIVMVYLLNAKQTFAAQSKKLLYSLLGLRLGNAAIENARYAHRVFGGFINGKLLDSLIVGVICFIFLSVTNMPYAMLISVIVGVTNIIPFFGPFLGAIPSALLLLFESPPLCLYFLIFIVILQQIDGNIIGPRILGGATGLPSFWVLFSILLFGGMFGFIGMVLGVPLFALVYSLAKSLIKRRLEKHELPRDTASYDNLHHMDDESHAPVKNSEV
jgi:predicted PurR-regulated permease PerM